MYVPARFNETDPETTKALIREHSFGALIAWDGVRPVATHVPFLLKELPDNGLALQGHVSRENPSGSHSIRTPRSSPFSRGLTP